MVVHAPVQVIDSFLFQFSVGQVLLYTFLASVPVAVVLRSWRVFGLQTVVFGLILVGTPSSLLGASTGTPFALTAPQFRVVGLGMLLLGPLVLTLLSR